MNDFYIPLIRLRLLFAYYYLEQNPNQGPSSGPGFGEIPSVPIFLDQGLPTQWRYFCQAVQLLGSNPEVSKFQGKFACYFFKNQSGGVVDLTIRQQLRCSVKIWEHPFRRTNKDLSHDPTWEDGKYRAKHGFHQHLDLLYPLGTKAF